MNSLAEFSQSPYLFFVFLLSIILAITVHEFAHAWTAYKLGDDTPYLQGRVTLNPLAHLDPLGSIAFLLFHFGWGKPVVYNPLRLKRHGDELLIALAGPFSNLLMALGLNILVFLLHNQLPYLADPFTTAATVNVVLAAFNFLPLPPLDGASLVTYFWPEYGSLMSSQIGSVILLVVIFLSLSNTVNVLGIIVSPLITIFELFTHLFGVI